LLFLAQNRLKKSKYLRASFSKPCCAVDSICCISSNGKISNHETFKRVMLECIEI